VRRRCATEVASSAGQSLEAAVQATGANARPDPGRPDLRPARRLGPHGARIRAPPRRHRRSLRRRRRLFAAVLEAADGLLEPGAPFRVHFSDIAYANRNETKHLAYGEGTLRAEPLGEALSRFERPATVISESPDEASHQAIRAALAAAATVR
jgi:hypothetical protein